MWRNAFSPYIQNRRQAPFTQGRDSLPLDGDSHAGEQSQTYTAGLSPSTQMFAGERMSLSYRTCRAWLSSSSIFLLWNLLTCRDQTSTPALPALCSTIVLALSSDVCDLRLSVIHCGVYYRNHTGLTSKLCPPMEYYQ